MIEVIKHGKEVVRGIVITRCPNCGCVFKFTDAEDTGHDTIACEDFVNCPDCGGRVTVHDTSCWNDNPNAYVCEVLNGDDI